MFSSNHSTNKGMDKLKGYCKSRGKSTCSQLRPIWLKPEFMNRLNAKMTLKTGKIKLRQCVHALIS